MHQLTLVAIVARGHPSLRVVKTHAHFNYSGLRQITAALPQLTEFSIYHVDATVEPISVDFLEYCGNLEVLFVSLTTGVTTSRRSIVLDSLAAHCHNLHTLWARGLTPGNEAQLDAVVEACPRLRKLRIGHTMHYVVPANRPDLVVNGDDVKFAEFLPAELAY